MTGILVIDVGNTSAHFGYFANGILKKTSRIPTPKMNDEALHGLRRVFPWESIQAVVAASVVPNAGRTLLKKIPRFFGKKTYLVGKTLRVPIRNRYASPAQVGMDRLMNAVAVHEKYGRDTIILDFGTAITVDIVTKKGEYLGGAIAPGVEISLEALYERTALLPKIRLVHPRGIIGRNTVQSIRAGCSYGIGGLCDRLVLEAGKTLRSKALVIATGGYASYMSNYCKAIHKIEPDLTLNGIYQTYLAAR